MNSSFERLLVLHAPPGDWGFWPRLQLYELDEEAWFSTREFLFGILRDREFFFTNGRPDPNS